MLLHTDTLLAKDVFRKIIFGDESCSSITMGLAMCLFKGFLSSTPFRKLCTFYLFAFGKKYKLTSPNAICLNWMICTFINMLISIFDITIIVTFG